MFVSKELIIIPNTSKSQLGEEEMSDWHRTLCGTMRLDVGWRQRL